jgi:WD40 repeat protein
LLDLNAAEAAPHALGEVLGWRFSPDRRFLLTTNLSDEGTLYSLSDLSRPPTALGVTDGLAFSEDGRWMATHATDQELLLRDLSQVDAPPVSLGAGARFYAFSPDGRFFAVIGPENTSRLINLASAATKRELPPASDFGFSRSGRFLLLLRYPPEQSLVLDLSSADQAPRAIGPVDFDERDSFAFSTNDRFLLTRSPRAESLAYDLVLHDLSDNDGAPIQLGQALRYYSSRMSSDGRYLVTLDESRNATLRDLGAPTLTARPLGQLEEGIGFSFSADGRFVAIVNNVGDGYLYFTSEDRDPIPLGRIDYATFSNEGRYLVVDNTEVRDLEAMVAPAGDGALRSAMCRSGDAIAPFESAMRATGGQPLNVYRALRGRPWNPCDWRGLLAVFPNVERGDGWFEGARQWLRLIHVRQGGADYTCQETTSAASVETRARRQAICQRFAEPASPAPT